ncbi:hypothetical protein BHE74_00056659 [Ensete ventricosum]|nr:hypothetical protein BHE74_00056659 [Ensete ventricosum]RZS24855.1 hypothetical protein BHM03_00057969 [Ensete ventricosum]
MSLAPNDVHQNQIQFALERGIPAYLGVLGTKRLPYPSRSFEFAHCSRCRIDWLQRDGILLLELDRLLRPGGYFAYSSPEAYAQDEEDLRIWKEMSALVERMCWKIAAKRNQTVIWVKPLTNDCYMKREPGTRPPLCRYDDDPDAVWGIPVRQVTGTQNAHYQAVPPKTNRRRLIEGEIDRRRSIEGEIDRRWSIEERKGKKKEEKKKKEEEKKEYRVALAHASSPPMWGDVPEKKKKEEE